MADETKVTKLSALAVDDAADEVVDDPEAVAEAAPEPSLPASEGDDVPPWALVPQHLRIPKGRQVVFIRFRAEMTDTPLKGERQCMVWSLSDSEERLANDRCEGKNSRAPAEYTKQMVRAVDGIAVDWSRSRGPGSLDEFWREIGPKGRNMLLRIYTRLHLANDSEVTDFFESCVAVRTVGN
jgi:hypothetical protein